VSVSEDAQKTDREVTFDRHAPDYRLQFERTAAELLNGHRVSWNDSYGGYWFAAGNREVFEIARSAERISNDRDDAGERRGYRGITIPSMGGGGSAPSLLESDPPEQRHYRNAMNPYLSPAAVERWRPFVAELVRACLDERIETGEIDFVDDLANVIPAVLTLAMMGLPIADWDVYCEPAHAVIYTKPDSPDMPRVVAMSREMTARLAEATRQARTTPRPGLIDALVTATINGRNPTDEEVTGNLVHLIGGGFDTTTALTAHALEWLSENPAQRGVLSRDRERLLNSATEEFLRFYTPAQGDGRTISADWECAGVQFREGERIWLSWAMANRDPEVFPEPDSIVLDRPSNRHSSFGLGIHRCLGSNVARMTFKQMLVAVLDRLPDYVCDPSGAVHYETIGIINGMQHLPATFTPGTRLGAGLAETLETLQRVVDEQRLAAPVVPRRRAGASSPAAGG
jgi:cytochrome P450